METHGSRKSRALGLPWQSPSSVLRELLWAALAPGWGWASSAPRVQYGAWPLAGAYKQALKEPLAQEAPGWGDPTPSTDDLGLGGVERLLDRRSGQKTD